MLSFYVFFLQIFRKLLKWPIFPFQLLHFRVTNEYQVTYYEDEYKNLQNERACSHAYDNETSNLLSHVLLLFEKYDSYIR